MQNVNLERGAQLFEIGRYKEAIPYIVNSLTDISDNFEAKYLLAQCYYLTGEETKALNLALELRSFNPNFDSIYFLLSQIYLSNDKIKEALEQIDIAINLNPYEESFFGQKSYIKINQKEFNKALFFADEGLKINAKSDFCLNARATALTKLKRNDEVEVTIENLLNDNPENDFSHANVGWSYLEKNKILKAQTHFKEALKLNPNSDFAREGMITAVKANNKIYNLYLRYAFWISNKSQKNQWFFIIGIYLVYRFSVKLLSASGLTFIAIPLIIVYLIFALGSWFIDPLSNMILLFDKFGKYLLDKNKKLSGQIFFVLLMCSGIFFLIYLFLRNQYFILVSASFIAALLPLVKFPLAESNKNRIFNLSYGLIIVLTPIIGSLIGYPNSTLAISIGVMFIAYTWLGNLFID